VALRLAIGRDGIGIELAEPVELACLRVTELAIGFPDMRFPADVSGGVARFRHRRGELARMEVEIVGSVLEAWLSRRLEGVVCVGAPQVSVRIDGSGATITVAAPERDAPDDWERAERAILVFDAAVTTEGDALEIVVGRARGTGLAAPPMALALACASRALGNVAEGKGALFVVHAAARRLATAILPEGGARAPYENDIRWAWFTQRGEVHVLHALRGSIPAPPPREAVWLREASDLLRSGDGLLADDPATARGRYLEAHERAPRHPEVIARIVGIDACVVGREEAALALLAEGRTDGRTRLGSIPGKLLLQTGDRAAAVASLERAARVEESASLAAHMLLLAARHAEDPDESQRLLDDALSHSPRCKAARWARLKVRLELGRPEDALADAESLEAMTESTGARHALWVRAGRAWQGAGLSERAAGLFERALLSVPDEPSALAGLGESLARSGHPARGASLLRRALGLAEGAEGPHARAEGVRLSLARTLAELLDDLPAAVAVVSRIAPEATEAPVARGLEGRWRAELGDFSAAGLAFARLRDLAEGIDPAEDQARASMVSGLLREAATIQRERDPGSAKRLLAAALRLAPRDVALRQAFRDAATETQRGQPPGPTPSAPEVTEARVEELTRRLRANPADDAAANELGGALRQLRRGHELVALLLGPLEEASGERRAFLAQRARQTLERCISEAERDGLSDEAALFRSALQAVLSMS
jgi:tetratricopeptide (TPR) repeat protein